MKRVASKVRATAYVNKIAVDVFLEPGKKAANYIELQAITEALGFSWYRSDVFVPHFPADGLLLHKGIDDTALVRIDSKAFGSQCFCF